MKTTKTWMTLAGVVVSVVALAQDEPQEPKVLINRRAQYEKAVKSAVDPITRNYILDLTDMKKELGGRGDIAGATAVEKEIDALKASGPSPDGTLVGMWRVTYTNASVRVYAFSADGTVTMAELSGHCKKIGDKYLIDLNDGKCETWAKKGDGYDIKHFNPKSTYPKGKPTVVGTARKIE